MTSADEISKMFQTESEKLKNLINLADSKSDLSLHEIVETYYQIMNVSSMASMLVQQLNENEHKPLLEEIHEIQDLISTKFNSKIHPKILNNLSNSIQETTKNLQSQNQGEKSKEKIENESEAYEKLRKIMSTKEFVVQYDKGLSND